MSERKEFRLPDVGEGLTEADIVSWHVKPGDEVAINQVIVEIETAKAVVELPCPFEGIVADLLVADGQTVDVGTPIIAVDVTGSAPVAGPAGSGPAQPPTPASVSIGSARMPNGTLATVSRPRSARRCSSATASRWPRRPAAGARPPPRRPSRRSAASPSHRPRQSHQTRGYRATVIDPWLSRPSGSSPGTSVSI